ncbi:hypothetical protein [Algiphilus sp.]|uniref:hypothetical protein n=1 Tax=Algiphilus sp. TaxID=1872431 RepID=UPI003B529CED
MEPLTAATTFAGIVGLISNFKSERRATSADEYQEFIDWLGSKRHQAVLDEIGSNHLLGLSIKGLLSQNHEQVMSVLDSLNESVSKLAAHIQGLAPIAQAVTPNAALSEQAVSILEQLERSRGSFFLELKTSDGTGYHIMDGAGGLIEIEETRFVDDDLESLCSLGLLRPDRNSQGHRLWRITREAVKLVRPLPER